MNIHDANNFKEMLYYLSLIHTTLNTFEGHSLPYTKKIGWIYDYTVKWIVQWPSDLILFSGFIWSLLWYFAGFHFLYARLFWVIASTSLPSSTNVQSDIFFCVFGSQYRSRVQRFPGPKSRPRVQRFQNALGHVGRLLLSTFIIKLSSHLATRLCPHSCSHFIFLPCDGSNPVRD